MNNKTAILIFTRFAEDEAKKKGFLNLLGKKKATLLTEKLISQTQAEARKTKLSVFTFYPSSQHGSSFGEKLANCIEDVYRRGFTRIMVIGNDCPSITCQLLNHADSQLDLNKIVVGPCNDGGIYLLGIKKANYIRNKFIEIPWLSPAVFNSFIAFAKETNTDIESLKIETDIDDFESLITWTRTNLKNTISNFVSAIINSQNKTITSYLQNVHTPSSFSSSLALRGPPCYSF